MRVVFGRAFAAEPDRLVEQLRGDEAIAEADTLLLTVPNQPGVDYNAHVLDAVLTHVAPALVWVSDRADVRSKDVATVQG